MNHHRKTQAKEELQLHQRVRLIVLGIAAASRFYKKGLIYTNNKYSTIN